MPEKIDKEEQRRAPMRTGSSLTFGEAQQIFKRRSWFHLVSGLRQGVRYALARRAVAIFRIAASAAIAYGAVVELHRHHAHYLWGTAAIGLAAALLLATRHVGDRLADRVDRRFFREAYNTEQILTELSNEVRTIVETKPLLATVAQSISVSLHVPRIALLLREGNAFEIAYSVGCCSISEAHLSKETAIIEHLHRSHEPVRVDASAGQIHPAPGVTQEERLLLQSLGSELLLPMSVKGRLVGFISLGRKQSEEPYSGHDVRLLQSLATQAGLAIENSRLAEAIAQEKVHREKMNRELEIAREVQQRLFPQELPEITGLDYFATCRPALRVGGDYYDFLALREGKLGIAVGDVSGKGIGAALMMASLQGSVRAQLLHGNHDLTRLMAGINSLLHQASEADRYATLFYAEYDSRCRRLTYVNAGHNAPILFRRQNAQWDVQRLETGGMVVGLLADTPFEEATIELKRGDLLVAFTDGISEAMSSRDEQFGETRLMQTVESCFGFPTADIAGRVLCAVDEFVGNAPQHDDMTLLVINVA